MNLLLCSVVLLSSFVRASVDPRQAAAILKLMTIIPNWISKNTMSEIRVTLHGEKQFLTEAIDNGLLCDEKRVAAYSQGDVSKFEKEFETAFPTNQNGLDQFKAKVNCATPTEEFAKCICGTRAAAVCTLYYEFYVARKKHGPVKSCAEDTKKEMKLIDPVLAKLYGEGNKAINDDDLNKLFISPEIAGLLCQISGPKVEQVVAKLYKSEFVYLTADQFYGLAKQDIVRLEMFKAQCQKEQASHIVLKCVCDTNKGSVLCGLQFISEFYQDIGYLKCTGGTSAMDMSKMPSQNEIVAVQVNGYMHKKMSSATKNFSIMTAITITMVTALRI